MIGATLPGTPAVALGRNRYIAWGATNVAADVEDLYRERLDDAGTPRRVPRRAGAADDHPGNHCRQGRRGRAPRRSRHAPRPARLGRHQRQQRRVERRAEAAGARAAGVPLDRARRRRHDAVGVPEAERGAQLEPVHRRAPRLRRPVAELRLRRRRRPHRLLRAGPHPDPRLRRRLASRPTGGRGDAEWTGWIPFEELPHLYDPPEHFIVTANHRPAPPSYPLSARPRVAGAVPRAADPRSPQRRSRDGPAATGSSPPTTSRASRPTRVSLHAKALLPLLLAHAHPDAGRSSRRSTLLQKWDGDVRRRTAAPRRSSAPGSCYLAPVACRRRSRHARWRDRYSERFTFVTRFVVDTLSSERQRRGATTRRPARGDVRRRRDQALREAVADLTERLGSDMSRWRWDGVHRAVFPHQGLDAVAALRPLLSRSVPNGGDWSTVNVAPVAADAPLRAALGARLPRDHRSLARQRQPLPRRRRAVGAFPVAALRRLSRGLARGAHRKMRMERPDVEAGAIGRLHLTPR